MKNPLLLALFFVSPSICSSLVAAPVDLTPVRYVRMMDGSPWEGLNFHQEDKLIDYRPPAKWEFSGSPASFSFRAPDISSVRGEITHADRIPSVALDEAGLKALREMAENLVPKVSKNVVLLSETAGSIKIGNHAAVKYIYSGVLFGKATKYLVVLLPLQDECFKFLMYGDDKEFDAAASQFMGSLFSWRWTAPAP